MESDGHDVTYVIKCDNTDPKKHKKEKFCDIYTLLASFGVKANIHPYNSRKVLGCSLFQSERSNIYQEHTESLLDRGLAYFEDGNSGPVIFDVAKFARSHTSNIVIRDELLGELVFNIEDMFRGKPKVIPLRRSDGSYLFNLASVVDDGELGATHIVRGQDKSTVSPVQEVIRMALGFSSPTYIHLPLLLGQAGKRTGGYIQFDDLLRTGVTREALTSYMLSSGYGNPDEIFLSLESFIAGFDLGDLHRKNTKFSPERLSNINKRVMHLLSPDRYKQSIRLYAHEFCEDEKVATMGNDEDVMNFLEELRLSPKESIDLVSRIMFPEETPPDHTMIECIEQIADRLKSGMHYDDLCIDLADFDTGIFCSGLRWILMRETGGIELKKIFLLLERKGLLLEKAGQATKTLEQLKAFGSLP